MKPILTSKETEEMENELKEVVLKSLNIKKSKK
jgi:hypothetical protein